MDRPHFDIADGGGSSDADKRHRIWDTAQYLLSVDVGTTAFEQLRPLLRRESDLSREQIAKIRDRVVAGNCLSR